MAISGFSDYLELELLDHLFGKGAYTPPTIYVAASTADPDEDGSGVSEPSGNGYARVQTSGVTYNAASGGSLTSAAAIEWPEATGAWGTITHIALYDAATNGNFLGGGALAASKAITSGEILRIPAASFTVTLT